MEAGSILISFFDANSLCEIGEWGEGVCHKTNRLRYTHVLIDCGLIRLFVDVG